MREYYCYAYYDEHWQPYYVGKGSKRRAFKRQDKIPKPVSNDFIQIFYFDFEWQADECEIHLISFWQRKLDGGTLLNICLGGPGAPGRPMSNKHYEKIMSSCSKPISLTNIETNEVREFKSTSEAGRQLNIPLSSLRSLRLLSRPASKTCHKWRLTNA